MTKKILIVDDEKKIVDILSYNLKKEGYETICAYDGIEGQRLALEQDPDLILLDIMMPRQDGFETCKSIRKSEKGASTPIIMLTARAEEVDVVLGLELGADDYMSKPFRVRELMARIKANLRRNTAPKDAETGHGAGLVFGELTIDEERYDVEKRGQTIELTLREYELLKFLAKQKSQIFTRESLLEKVWGYEYFGDVRTVDVTIRRLREKIEDDPGKPGYILTKRGVGYYFANI